MRMNRIFLGLPALLLLAAVGAQGLPPTGKSRAMDGAYSERTPRPCPQPNRQSPDSVRGALLRMDVTTHDFGEVPRKGGDLVKDFSLVNAGTVPLVLTRVVTSCSCLKATFPKRPVPPGGEAVIRITYEPHKSEPGTFHKVVQIYSNSVDGRHVLIVQGCSLDRKENVKE